MARVKLGSSGGRGIGGPASGPDPFAVWLGPGLGDLQVIAAAPSPSPSPNPGPNPDQGWPTCRYLKPPQMSLELRLEVSFEKSPRSMQA